LIFLHFPMASPLLRMKRPNLSPTQGADSVDLRRPPRNQADIMTFASLTRSKPVETRRLGRPAFDLDLVTQLTALHAYLEQVAAPTDVADGAERLNAPAQVLHRLKQATEEARRHIVEQGQRIAELEEITRTDAMTGLLNRRGFEEELSRALASARRYGETGVLAYIDLNDFKQINDLYGHEAGDRVLMQVGGILAVSIRETDYAARLGGDEFALLLTKTGWRDGRGRARKVARHLNETFVTLDGRPVRLSASAGVEAYGAGDDEATLLSRADGAMYRAKRRYHMADKNDNWAIV
jgi:diguanylate cyclase (GGDEF)-like protein